MSTSCDTTPVRHETVNHGPLRFELWIAKQLCVVPDGQTTNLSTAELSVRVTNTGPSPVQLVVANPDAVIVHRIGDIGDMDAALELGQGPEPDDITTTQVEILSGQSWNSAPVENYMGVFAPDIMHGTYVNGTPLPPASRLQRIFGIEAVFSANVNFGSGFKPLRQTLKGQIESIYMVDEI